MGRAFDKDERSLAAWIEERERPDRAREGGAGAGLRRLPAALARGYGRDLGRADDERQLFPEERWQGPWGDRALELEEAALARDDARLPADPLRLTPLQRAVEAQRRVGLESSVDAASAPVLVEELPRDWDAARAQEALEGLAGRLTRRVEDLQSGRQRWPSNTIHGDALVPGSTSVSSLRPREFAAALALPPPEAAVELDLALDTDADHWAVDGADTGPGRIWKVVGHRRGAAFRDDGGPMRYRLVGPRQRFGVVSLELQDSGDGAGDPILQANYGIFVRGIPGFGLRPRRVVHVDAVGDFPVAYGTREVSTGGTPDGPFSLFTAPMEARYQTAEPAFMSELASSTFLSPQAGGIRRCGGFSFGLITGRDEEAVFREVNTRETTYGRVWGNDGGLGGMTLPLGLEVRPPCPGQSMEWNGSISPPGFDDIGQAAAATETRLVEGLPLLYRDCGALAQSAETFSMVVQPLVIRSKTLGGGDTWDSPAAWSRYGMVTDPGSDRSWALDVIVW